MPGTKPSLSPSRRDVLIGTTVGATIAATMPANATEPFWTARYQAQKGEVILALYRKRLDAPRAGEAQRPVLFLVHGSSISALPSFDLMVPGAGEYSLMNVFARDGFDVWTMDFEGYGKSTVTTGNSDIASGVADLRAALPIVEQETGQSNSISWAKAAARYEPRLLPSPNRGAWTGLCWKPLPIPAKAPRL